MAFSFKAPGLGRVRLSKLTNEDNITNKASTLSLEDDEEDIPNFEIMDLSDDNGDDDNDEFVRELTANEIQDFQMRFARSASTTLVSDRYSSVMNSSGIEVRPEGLFELPDGDFFYVDHISRAYGIDMKGTLFRRTWKVDDMLPKKRNELCAILKAQTGVADPSFIDCLVSRPIDDALLVREVIFTNRPFPALSFRERPETYGSWDEVMERTVLVCRWKHTEFCDLASRKVTSQSLMQLREFECTPGKGAPDTSIKQMWRGCSSATKKSKTETATTATPDLSEVTKEEFESKRSQKAPVIEVDLTNDEDDSDFEIVEEEETRVTKRAKRVSRAGTYEKRSNSITSERFTLPSAIGRRNNIPTQTAYQTSGQYTYGDICTGAGGMACGAVMAGLVARLFLDHCEDACTTLQLNFSKVLFLLVSIFALCTGNIPFRPSIIDILHISFPCQPHSPAHTRPGQNDEANIATGYSAMPIVEIFRPRIVTFEQTPGIVTHRGGWHFRALVHQLTAMNYSVRWRIVNCAEHGAAHARKRLIIIAAW